MSFQAKTKASFSALLAFACLFAFQNCSYPIVQNGSTSSAQGGTGADGKVYANYARTCPDSPARAANLISIAKDQQSGLLIRKDCQDLVGPQPLDIKTLSFSFNDSSVFQVNGQIYDLQIDQAAQRVTVQICKSANVQAEIWQNIGQANAYFGRVTLVDGSTSGALNVLAPATAPPEYKSVSGQSSQFDLALSSPADASLTYQIGANSQISVLGLNCASQNIPGVPDDGSKNAPAGSAPKPALLNGYAVRPTWMVAGVNYAVGFPSGQVLKDAATDPALASNPSVTIDNAAAEIQIHGDNVVLDSYDFTLHGYTLNVISGSGTVVKNSKVSMALTQVGTSNLTVTNCIVDGGGANGPYTLVGHSGGGTLTLTYNWFRNFQAHAVDANGGGAIVLKYNLIENGGMKTGAGLSWLQLSGSAAFSSVAVEFNTAFQPLEGSADEGFKFYGGSAAIQGEIAYNTLIATAPAGKVAMSYIIHVGGGAQLPALITAAIHDNYLDTSGAYGPFYPGMNNDGNTQATYTGNMDLVSGSPFTTNP